MSYSDAFTKVGFTEKALPNSLDHQHHSRSRGVEAWTHFKTEGGST